MRLSLAKTSLLSAAVLGAPCTREGTAPCPDPCCSVAVLNFSPRAGSSSSNARCDLQDANASIISCPALEEVALYEIKRDRLKHHMHKYIAMQHSYVGWLLGLQMHNARTACYVDLSRFAFCSRPDDTVKLNK